MARQFPAITEAHREFVARQHVFFVASAAIGAEGLSHVNLSPRSTREFRLLGPNQACWLDRTGSGNETAAHSLAGGRITVMLCAFDGPPLIFRLYGRGTAHRHDSETFATLLAQEFGGEAPLGTRQIVTLDVELVQTSCGFGVPFHHYEGERDAMDKWANAKGDAGIAAYWQEKNQSSLDGLPTGLLTGSPDGPPTPAPQSAGA